MTGRERMGAAMRPRDGVLPDRVPVMCQLALGHYFLNAGIPAIEIWYDGQGLCDALIRLQTRYGFDGILVNLPGRNPDWRQSVARVEQRGETGVIWWLNGTCTAVPPDENPFVVTSGGARLPPRAFAAVDPDRLFYVEPHDLLGTTCWDRLPPWCSDTVSLVRRHAPDISVHAEVFSPFSQFIELVGCEIGMMALADDAGKVSACLQRLTLGASAVACGHLSAGADAILVSSAFAGGGLISRRHYERFVLPAEHAFAAAVHQAFPDRPIYTHTCGAIGDRLDLIEQTGTDGIDTLDPPPLGTVDLADAKRRVGGRLFLKGNLDPVNTLLHGSPDVCYREACQRIEIGARGGGYILSTACSVPPRTPPANLLQLARAANGGA